MTLPGFTRSFGLFFRRFYVYRLKLRKEVTMIGFAIRTEQGYKGWFDRCEGEQDGITLHTISMGCGVAEDFHRCLVAGIPQHKEWDMAIAGDSNRASHRVLVPVPVLARR